VPDVNFSQVTPKNARPEAIIAVHEFVRCVGVKERAGAVPSSSNYDNIIV